MSSLINPIVSYHKQTIKICNYCDFETATRELIIGHIEEYHGDQVIPSDMFEKVTSIKESFDLFETFKVELKDILNKLIDEHNAVKQELFMIRNNQANDTKMKDIDASIKRLSSLIGASSNSNSKPATIPSSPTTEGLNKHNSPHYQPPKRHQSPPPQRRHPDPPQPEFQAEPKILFIGDSISASANIKVVEEATRAKVVTSKAYSAIHDEVTNVAKKPAFYPHKKPPRCCP